MANPIVFLTYMSRSGSTLLSTKLNEYGAIGVSIEGRFPAAWTAGEIKTIADPAELDVYLHILYANREFLCWNVDRDDLVRSLLASKSFPLHYADILETCLDLYFSDRRVEYYVYKAGQHYLYIDSLRAQFPGAKFLFIDRNPLAIFNSQKKSLDGNTRKPMRTDPVDFVLNYNEVQDIIDKHRNSDYLHIVSYEGLISDEDKELAAVLDFMGVKDRSKDSSREYYKNIPDYQRHLHANVQTGNIKPKRIDAWLEELEAGHQKYLQTVLRSRLDQKGYTCHDDMHLSSREVVRYAVNMLRHNYVKIRGFKPQH